ncbi:MAG: histidine kinase N-terminal 7TM domain-containing protein [Candidatus Pacebacteria bacterium]|nr:histidine kinase N-terminal 7TM domain-containing protein [Candidatus Paceibacterota bacterium]
MILYSAISGFLNGIAVIVFGLLVWFNCPRKKVRNLMILMCFVIAVWGISWGFAAIAKDRILSSFLNRVLDFSALFIPIFFLHWVLVLLEKERKNKIILITGYLITLSFVPFAFTDYFLTVEPASPFYFYPKAGALHLFYLISCYIGLVGFAFYELLKANKESVGYTKAQIKYVLLGGVLGFGGGATNFFLFYNIPILPYGNPLVAIGFSLLTYAVIRYRLMDIKIALSRIIAYSLSFTTIIILGIGLAYLNYQLKESLSYIILFPLFIFISISILYVHKWYERFIIYYFYPSFYNTKIAIADLEEKLSQVLELDLLSRLIINTLKNIFRIDKIAILIKDSRRKRYIIKHSLNFRKEDLAFLSGEGFLISFVEKNKKTLIKEEIQDAVKGNILNKMTNAGIEVLIPIIFQKKVIAVIILSNKVSKEAFSLEDLLLLEVFSNQVSIALKNATLFSEINKRKEELERFYRLTVSRELRIKELEKKIKELKERLEKKE